MLFRSAYNYHLGYNFAATASYSIYNRSYSNVGLGVTVNFGPLEIYCLTDNILSFGMLRQESNSSTSSRLYLHKEFLIHYFQIFHLFFCRELDHNECCLFY